MKKLIIYILLLFGALGYSQGSLRELEQLRQTQINNIVVGVEISPQDNAASIDTEVNSRGSWLGLGAGNPVSTATDAPSGGSYMLSQTSADGNNDYFYIDFSIVSGRTYNISLWAKSSTNTGEQIRIDNDYSESPTNITSVPTSWTNYTWSLVASSTMTGRIRCYSGYTGGGGSGGEILYIDNVSIKEIE